MAPGSAGSGPGVAAARSGCGGGQGAATSMSDITLLAHHAAVLGAEPTELAI